MRPGVALAVLLLSLTLDMPGAEEYGGLRGQVVDAAGAPIGADVRVVDPKTLRVVRSFRGEDDGLFRAGFLPVGVYSIRVVAPGFLRREVTDVAIGAERITDIGSMTLEVAGCDAPGVSCHVIQAGNTQPPGDDREAEDYVTLEKGCAADLDRKGSVICGDRRARNTDIVLERYDEVLYLVAAHGAAVSAPGAPTGHACSRAEFGSRRVAVAGLGPGVDFCVRTSRGLVSHVFFTEDVEPKSSSIALWYVTRTRAGTGPR